MIGLDPASMSTDPPPPYPGGPSAPVIEAKNIQPGNDISNMSDNITVKYNIYNNSLQSSNMYRSNFWSGNDENKAECGQC